MPPPAAVPQSRFTDVTDGDVERMDGEGEVVEEERWSDDDDDDDDVSSDGRSESRSLSVLSSEPEIRVTDAEIEIIRDVSLRHDERYKSVGFGEELIKEMVMCSVFGIPLSTSASIQAYRLMIQRITKVAHNFEHFLDMTHPVQTALLKQNADLIVSLRGAVFFDERKHGLEQVRKSKEKNYFPIYL